MKEVCDYLEGIQKQIIKFEPINMIAIVLIFIFVILFLTFCTCRGLSFSAKMRRH